MSTRAASPPATTAVTVAGRAERSVLISCTGVRLPRATTFRFTLDPTPAQHQQLLSHAGAARMTFNHQLARVKANLDQREAERSYGIPAGKLTPSLSWSKVSFINHMNECVEERNRPGQPGERVRRPGPGLAF